MGQGSPRTARIAGTSTGRRLWRQGQLGPDPLALRGALGSVSDRQVLDEHHASTMFGVRVRVASSGAGGGAVVDFDRQPAPPDVCLHDYLEHVAGTVGDGVGHQLGDHVRSRTRRRLIATEVGARTRKKIWLWMCFTKNPSAEGAMACGEWATRERERFLSVRPSCLLVFSQLRYQQEVLGHPAVQISAGGRIRGPESGTELPEAWGTGMMAPEGIGALLRSIREAAGLTREEQAAVLQAARGGKWFDPENLKRWETEKRLPTPMWHALLAECYGRSTEEIVRAVVVSRRRRRLHRLIDEGAREEGSAVDRRKFLGVAAAATGMAGLPDIAEARQGINAGLSTADSGDLAYLNGAFERHRGGYRGRPPNEVLDRMKADLDLLRELLGRPHPAAVRKDLARTATGITGLMAIIQHDRGDQRDAVGWFATAEQAARESDDRQMLAWVLSRHAMVPLNYGAPHAAAAMAIRARAEAGRSPSAAGALAAAVTARSLASLGDREGALRAVADARAAAARLDSVQGADTLSLIHI